MRRPTRKNKEIFNIKMNDERNEKQKLENFKDRQRRLAGDSETRIKMHREILQAIEEGKSKEEILEMLLSKEEYNEYRKHFKSYIDDKFEQNERKKQGKERKRFDWSYSRD